MLTGQGIFIGDIGFPHQLHMRIVRSPHANAVLRSVNIATALAAPGIVAVWTAADIADLPPIDFRDPAAEALRPYRQPLLARERLRYVGEPIAVVLAAEAYGVEPGMIAKTLSLRVGERVILIVAAGTSRMDNRKVKAQFGGKPKMLGLEEVADITGHEVGGVCPFGLKSPLPVYCDISLKTYDGVVPAAGSTHSAVRITPDRLAELTAAEWVDVCEHRP